MKNPLLRVSVIFTVLYFAVGVVLVVITSLRQGTGWMHFSLSQLLVIYLGLFTVPLTLLLWVGWAALKYLRWAHSTVALAVFGTALPFMYALILYLAGPH